MYSEICSHMPLSGANSSVFSLCELPFNTYSPNSLSNMGWYRTAFYPLAKSYQGREESSDNTRNEELLFSVRCQILSQVMPQTLESRASADPWFGTQLKEFGLVLVSLVSGYCDQTRHHAWCRLCMDASLFKYPKQTLWICWESMKLHIPKHILT